MVKDIATLVSRPLLEEIDVFTVTVTVTGTPKFKLIFPKTPTTFKLRLQQVAAPPAAPSLISTAMLLRFRLADVPMALLQITFSLWTDHFALSNAYKVGSR